jgi:hypothetical protein
VAIAEVPVELVADVAHAIAAHRHVHGQEQRAASVAHCPAHQGLCNRPVLENVQLKPAVQTRHAADFFDRTIRRGRQRERDVESRGGTGQCDVTLRPEQRVEARRSDGDRQCRGAAEKGRVALDTIDAREPIGNQQQPLQRVDVALDALLVVGAAFQIVEHEARQRGGCTAA